MIFLIYRVNYKTCAKTIYFKLLLQKKHELRKKYPKISKTQIAKTHLSKLTLSLHELNNPYLEIDLENLHL